MHEIDYLLDQFQRHADWSAESGPLFAWLHSSLVATWTERAESPSLPEEVVIPGRPADGVWTDPDAKERGAHRQAEWWQEGEVIVGLVSSAYSANDPILSSFYRFPNAALVLFRLGAWYSEQHAPQSVQLLQPLLVLATAWAPDPSVPTKEQGYALVQRGEVQYVLSGASPVRQAEPDLWLDDLPVVVLQRRSLRQVPPDSYVNEHGHLCFVDLIYARSWFIDWITDAQGALLPSTDLRQALLVSSVHSRPPLPDLETMQRYQSDLHIDRQMHTLTEAERQKRIAFLMHAVAQIRHAFPPASLQALVQGIERILEDVQARRTRTHGDAEAHA